MNKKTLKGGTSYEPDVTYDFDGGFRLLILQEGNVYVPDNPGNNYLLFVKEGSLQVSCNHFIRRVVRVNECVLIPVRADVRCVALSSCRLVSFAFHSLPEAFSGIYMAKLFGICKNTVHEFQPLPIHTPLLKFFTLLERYFHDGVMKEQLQNIKYREFFMLLQAFYSEQEVAQLLYPLIGRSPSFRLEVLRHYRQAKDLQALASSLRLNPRTFERHMKEEFGVSPYQWILTQKAQHIYFSLLEEREKSLEDIRRENGFHFAGHFTRFCKSQLGNTPMKLRRSCVASQLKVES